MTFAQKINRAKELCSFRAGAKKSVARVVLKENPDSEGIPIPKDRENDWWIYIAQYDPFNFDGKHRLHR